MGADLDRAGQASGDRAEAGMNVVHSFGVRSSLVGDGEPVVDSDPLDHEHSVVGFDLAGRLDVVALWIDFDLARLQRACERAGQSAAGRRNDVIERRGVWRVLGGIDAVVLGNLGVDPERDRVVLGRKVGEALWPAEPLDPDSRYVCDVAHGLDTTPVPARGSCRGEVCRRRHGSCFGHARDLRSPGWRLLRAQLVRIHLEPRPVTRAAAYDHHTLDPVREAVEELLQRRRVSSLEGDEGTSIASRAACSSRSGLCAVGMPSAPSARARAVSSPMPALSRSERRSVRRAPGPAPVKSRRVRCSWFLVTS